MNIQVPQNLTISKTSSTEIKIGGMTTLDIQEMVDFLRYLRDTNPEIRDAYVAFKTKDKVTK